MMEEQWKVIETYPNYAVSSLGRVKRLTTRNSARAGHVLMQQVASTGYPMLNLLNAQGRKRVCVHRLVAAAFVERPDRHNEVNHIDCDRSNNVSSNLEWVTSSGNRLHAYRVGDLCATGERNGYSKLTESGVRAIRDHLPMTASVSRRLASQLGVSQQTVRDVAARRTWTHV